ncbi:MAG TPA: transglutaminase-like cysteine peptidase [Devosiaceae bacterium]|jgi:predicted transglutaminase-like cysteine proteinase
MFTAPSIAKTLGAATLALFVLIAPALAENVDFSNAAFMPVSTKATSIPVGAAEFCDRQPKECAPNANVVPAMPLTQARWNELLTVNSYFNTSIVPVTDEQLYHTEEFWTYPNGYGDCEDIALAKRRQLIQSGWSPSDLLMTVAKQRNGEGHAVLMVRTDRGDFVLDNQDGTIRVWTDTPYHFLKRQSQANPAEWVDIYDERPIVIAAK